MVEAQPLPRGEIARVPAAHPVDHLGHAHGEGALAVGDRRPDLGPPGLVRPAGGLVTAADRFPGRLHRRVRQPALAHATRAACLRAIDDGRINTGLARRTGIAQPAAGEDAATLREAGLATTTRHRDTVLHTLTPLGQAAPEREPRSGA
ncbi:ArsR/SmtB family transcription factor [Streptomyces sp. NPDC002018]|uniref:ArsR/SmtB family transcription factor n=1 Tax=Streptomyces sp. NPDC002018 TaxID=3364629 RepID=UPI00368D892E